MPGELWPFRPAPFADELLSSWIARLAHGHGLRPASFLEIVLPGCADMAALDWKADRELLALLAKEVKAYLPRSSFPAGLEPGTSGPGVQIRVSKDRVDVLAYSGKASENSEMDRNGSEWKSALPFSSRRNASLAAFTADDHVYLEGAQQSPCSPEDVCFWIDFHVREAASMVAAVLMGADGGSLVYMQSNRGPIQLLWFNQP